METKVCAECGRELPIECFTKDKYRKDGICRVCKECKKKYNHNYHIENLENIKIRKKQYRNEHKENIKIQQKQWRDKNPSYNKGYSKQWRTTEYGYAKETRYGNLRADRDQGRIGKDEDPLPSLEYYMWALQQPDFYDGKYYPFNEMGLDRIYNDKPHTFANVVPCSTANNRRRGRKTFEEFCELMRKENEELTIACS